jgi:cytochrome P450
VLDALLPKSATHRLEPSVRATARATVALLPACGELEVMDEFAVPLVASGLWNLLGLKQPDEAQFIDQSRELMQRMWDPSGTADLRRVKVPGDRPDSVAEASVPPVGTPRPDTPLEVSVKAAVESGLFDQQGLLAGLVRARWRTYFPDRVIEITNIVAGLVGAALANTVSMVVSAVDHLATHPEDSRHLLEHKHQVGPVVEELLRLYPPQSPGRIVMRDTVLAGVDLRIGDHVLTSILGANRDSEVFQNPDQFNLGRSSKPHISFGVGRHHCVGGPFARMVLAVALEELHAAVPHYQISGRSALIDISPQTVPLRRLWIERSRTT